MQPRLEGVSERRIGDSGSRGLVEEEFADTREKESGHDNLVGKT
jgi:hypothetical protein